VVIVEKKEVLGVPVSVRNLDIETDLAAANETGRLVLISFVNPLACHLVEQSSEYKRHLQEIDWIMCDGIGMVVAANRTEGIDITRAAFDLTSLAGPVCEWLQKEEIPLVLVGGKPGISSQAAQLLSNLFPGLHVNGTFNGYDDDPAKAIKFMAAQKNAAIICGMGAPKQEEFLIKLRQTGCCGIGFTCGGFFDQIIDRIDYYPVWVDKMNLRFLYRLLKEPRRLWKRYLVDYRAFMKRFIRECLFR
jgi:N-acetylglucosaminyldiphosphoundecaprenol N-acetyl-beta-D-mannosaminyltransferase